MYTKGKWEVSGFFVVRVDAPKTKDQPAGATYICQLDTCAVSDEEAQANARLIAAAPELLEALKNCVVDAKQKLTKTERLERIKYAESAIAKAESEAQ